MQFPINDLYQIENEIDNEVLICVLNNKPQRNKIKILICCLKFVV